VQQDKDESLRCTLNSQRAVLIEDGMPTPRLVSVLKTIFAQYNEEESNSTTDVELTLGYTAASRLWYRCGMKLSCLDTMLEEKSSSSLPLITFEDFLAVIEKIVEEDETVFKTAPSKDETPDTICEVRAVTLKDNTRPKLSSVVNDVHLFLCRLAIRSSW
jgi:hypothetical protein